MVYYKKYKREKKGIDELREKKENKKDYTKKKLYSTTYLKANKLYFNDKINYIAFCTILSFFKSNIAVFIRKGVFLMVFIFYFKVLKTLRIPSKNYY